MSFSTISFSDFVELVLGLAALGFAGWLFDQMIRTFSKSKGAPERKPKPETHDEKVDRVRALVGDVLPALGAIMEQSPLTVFPATKPPIPKDEMKIALQLAWGMTTDERLRGFVEAGYMHLANFRDDVVSPIDPTLTNDMTPAQTVEKLDPYLAISKSMLAETGGLMRDFEEFKRLSSAFPAHRKGI